MAAWETHLLFSLCVCVCVVFYLFIYLFACMCVCVIFWSETCLFLYGVRDTASTHTHTRTHIFASMTFSSTLTFKVNYCVICIFSGV